MDNLNISQYDRMPRFDLREPAFRRYEPFMAQAAVKGQIIIQPFEFPASKTRQMKKANTFICRFYDAKTAYNRYHYVSRIIPKDFAVENLKCTELRDGSVLIENLMFTPDAPAPIMSCDHAGLIELAKRIKRGEIKSKSRIPIRIATDTEEEDLAFIETLQAETSEYYGSFVTTPHVVGGLLWVLMD